MAKNKKESELASSLTPFVIIGVIILAIIGLYLWQNRQERNSINSFEDCAAAGNPIMESYPEQCAANGKTFMKQY